eukprot:scaffold123900_cov17-Prasinocladus_malaysianus.AAC.1
MSSMLISSTSPAHKIQYSCLYSSVRTYIVQDISRYYEAGRVMRLLGGNSGQKLRMYNGGPLKLQ